jgi:hypothetical protein
MVIHLISLHQFGSNNPEGINSDTDKIRFHPYFTSKDLVGFIWMFIGISYFIFFAPNDLGHPDNSIPANPLVTPLTILPEWYFLFAYAILRSIPDKLFGVLAMFGALLILLPISFTNSLNIRSNRYRPIMKLLFWTFVAVELFLMFRFIVFPIFKLLKLQKGINYDDASKIIGNHFSEVGDKLTNFLQLSRDSDSHEKNSELLLASIDQKANTLQPVPFGNAINFGTNKKFLPIVIIPMLFFAFFYLFDD